MTRRLAQIWRHPLKGLGSEDVSSVQVTPEAAVIGDRVWALLNAAAPDLDEWQPRRNFLQVASGPKLAALSVRSQGDTPELSHPDLGDLQLDPRTDGTKLGDWLAPIWPTDRPGPARLVQAPAQGMTDVEYPSISIGNLASLRALSQRAGFNIDPRRFRINLWLEGLAPWEEIDLLDEPIQIGQAILTPVEPIERCRAPDANPHTGTRDINMLRALEDGWSTRNFGIYVQATQAATLHVGDLLK
ncbi:MOSC domain-containing protein [Roseobacteraceae bacterium S113]